MSKQSEAKERQPYKLIVRRPIIPESERFWTYVDKTGDCWEWTGGKARNGYGSFNCDDGKSRCAHRLAWEKVFGSIPNGLHVLHRCDNPPCCNPAHLFLGTPKDNMHDCIKKGRHRAPPHPSGELCPASKLTPDQVKNIRLAYHGADGTPALKRGKISQKQLALQYGVAQATIYEIVRGKSWKSV